MKTAEARAIAPELANRVAIGNIKGLSEDDLRSVQEISDKSHKSKDPSA
jgi:hypothetical protein